MQSTAVSDVVGINGSNIILQFLRTNVFPHEDYFAAHHYHFTLAFEEYSNTCLEGTNNGLKYNSESVLPSMSLAKAGKCMINQDECKASQRKRSASAAFNHVPLHASTGTCRKIQAVAETMMQEQLALVDRYTSVRISETQWYVVYSAERGTSSDVSPKPTFSRVRVVTLDEGGGLHCSCGYSNRNGVPDRHLAHVALNYGNSFHGFTHHDVAIRFWRAFDKFVAEGDPPEMDSRQLGIRDKLLQAHHCQPRITVPGGFRQYEPGQNFVVGKNSTVEFLGMDIAAALVYFQDHRKKVEVVNYSLSAATIAAMANNSSHSIGLTQDTFNVDDDHIEVTSLEVVDFQGHNDASFIWWQETGSTSSMTAHEILAPRFKELASVYEHQTEKLVEVAALLDKLIQDGKAENAALQQKPVGHSVSAVAPNCRAQHTHHRQKHHHYGK